MPKAGAVVAADVGTGVAVAVVVAVPARRSAGDQRRLELVYPSVESTVYVVNEGRVRGRHMSLRCA